MLRLSMILSILFVVLLAACAPQSLVVTEAPPEPSATALPTVPEPTEAAQPNLVETKAPEQPALSFEAATYRDETAGFELDYPSSWVLPDQAEQGSRGSIVQLSEAGKPRLDIVVLSWDPTNDLTAFVDARRQAWSASGFTIVSEEEISLAGDHEAVSFVTASSEGEQGLFFFTTVGERYLQLSGSGDLARLAKIARTVRPFGSGELLDIFASEPCLATEAEQLKWVACNLVDGLRSRNLSALHGYMADPFALGYWASEFRSASPAEITAELTDYRLPADPSSPMTFTTDREKFPPLSDVRLEEMFGPAVNIAQVIYSEGWGQDGAGSALLFIAQDDSGGYYWYGMIYSDRHFDE